MFGHMLYCPGRRAAPRARARPKHAPDPGAGAEARRSGSGRTARGGPRRG
ncbi:hypothetical protein SLI_6125 [Streptomyces lividans 1326]|uniref:Uncharacterized protein n=1 Tax=Streptomyces lividans 1326 TaxID=1200984 RepID=A0A7U9DVD1_STRLI|nr:hypothetical protein SLI_6125 [Streptomyces lividans 1326]